MHLWGVSYMRDLSVVIPARNERWLAKTIEDVLSHIEADTEIIAVLDGAWAEPGIPQHERVTVAYLPESIGQRAATNLGARISTATYVMKLDAHCAMDQGFDRKLIEAAKELGPDVTQIPAQHNLHVFDRICKSCGKREYQGPTDVPCVPCGETNWDIEVVWNPKRRRSESWAFDGTLRFMPNSGEIGRRPEHQGEIADVMTSLGACFFLSRERYWQLGGLDEAHGSWGQLGVELACKSWLSGGRQVVNKATWFSHCFRTQGHNFGMPYPITGDEQERARAYSRDLWFNSKWPGQVLPLRWLVEKFWPVQGWSEEQRDALPNGLPGRREDVDVHRPDGRSVLRPSVGPQAGVVYYTDAAIPDSIAAPCRESIEWSGLPIVSVSLKPIHWGAAKNLLLCEERGYLTMFRQILAGLEAIDSEFVFFCEHDVAYHPSHFSFTPPNHTQVFYNQNVWKVDAETGQALHYLCSQTSGLCASRELLLEHYRKRVALVEAHGFSRKMGFEPGTHRRAERVDDLTARTWMSEFPNVDIRHSHNLTPSRWKKEQFKDQRYTAGWTESDSIPGWGVTKGRFREFLQEAVGVQQAVA